MLWGFFGLAALVAVTIWGWSLLFTAQKGLPCMCHECLDQRRRIAADALEDDTPGWWET